MASDDDPIVPCRCCGTVTVNAEVARRLCTLCQRCDRRHGDELQHHVARLVRSGQIDAYHGLARMMIDDANLCARLAFVGDPMAATLWIPEAPRRWEVVVGRALALKQAPDLSLILQVTLARFVPGLATPERMQELANELTSALAFIDPNVLSVDVASRRDMRTAAAPGMVTVCAPDVEIPEDVMTRPRGQA